MQMHVHGQNHGNTSFAPVDSEEAGGCFNVIRPLGLLQVICEGQSIRTLASRHQMSRQKECQHYLWKLFGLWGSVKRENFQERQKAGIYPSCLPIAWCITPFKCENYNTVMLPEKMYVQEEYFCCDHPVFFWVHGSDGIQKASALIYSNPFFMEI